MEGLNFGILRYFSGSRAPFQRIYLENWPCILLFSFSKNCASLYVVPIF